MPSSRFPCPRALREQVAALAVKGAEQILQRKSTPASTPSCWLA
jgi:F0F1-type ATP synthase membrane subunit b/b'